MSQGANPWSDLGSREALRVGAKYLVRAVRDARLWRDHDASTRYLRAPAQVEVLAHEWDQWVEAAQSAK